MEQREKNIQGIIARADLYELLRVSFTFPTEEFARGLLGGSFSADLINCLREASFDKMKIQVVEEWTSVFEKQSDVSSLFSEMRKDYSHLYLEPGELRVTYPYEGAFQYVEKHEGKLPSLFFTGPAIDVERQMREAGVVPRDVRTEPVDSIYNEFEFMLYLYTQIATAMQQDDMQEVHVWQSRAEAFRNDHILSWVPRFLEKTQVEARSEIYRALADIALLVVRDIEE